MTEFTKLLQELDASDALIKAMPAPTDEDTKVAAAAADAGAGGEGAEPDAGAGNPEGEDPEEGEDPMAKSFKVQLESGETVDAIDATEMMKSFGVQLSTLGSAMERLVEMNKTLIGRITHAEEVRAGQNVLIKSLQGQVSAFGSQGAGRRTVLNIAEKSPATAAKPAVTAADIMVKAQSLYATGKMSSLDLSICEASVGGGRPLPERLAAAIAA